MSQAHSDCLVDFLALSILARTTRPSDAKVGSLQISLRGDERRMLYRVSQHEFSHGTSGCDSNELNRSIRTLPSVTIVVSTRVPYTPKILNETHCLPRDRNMHKMH